MSKSPTRACKLISDEIERQRQARGWTLEDLANAADIDVKTVSRAVNGEMIYFSTARCLARALNVSCESLLLQPPATKITRQSGRYTFSITTMGLVETPEQLALVSKIAGELVSRLRDSNIHVHDFNLQQIQHPAEGGPFAVVKVDAPRDDANSHLCKLWPNARSFAYILLPLDAYDRLINSSEWDWDCVMFSIHRGDVRGTAVFTVSDKNESTSLIRSKHRPALDAIEQEFDQVFSRS